MLNKTTLFFVLKIFITALVIYFIAHNLDTERLLKTIENLSYKALIGSMILFFIGLTLAAKRWQDVIIFQSPSPSFRELWRHVMMGFSLSQFLPSSVGGDVYRGLALRKYNISTEWAMSSTLIDRIYGLVGLMIMALVALPYEIDVLQQTILGKMMLLCFLGVAVSLIILMCVRFLSIQWPKRLAFIPRFSTTLGNIFFTSKKALFTLAISIISTTFMLLPFKILANDMNISLTFAQTFLGVSLVSLITALPISFAGWGLREGVMVVVLGAFGVQKEPALALSLMIGGVQLLLALPGFAIWFLARKKKAFQL